jgi:polyisoprenoid-binding protein YceI
VVSGPSAAIYRVREQLAGVNFPSDAVGCTVSVSGQLVLRLTGEFVPDASRVVVDLRDLKSNSDLRDNFIKMTTLQVTRYPYATFVPTRAEGLPNPLPATGGATFKLIGRMTARGVTREQTWDVTAKRTGSQLTGSATTSFKFGDFGMQVPRVPLVLSVVDEIRLELVLEATAAG